MVLLSTGVVVGAVVGAILLAALGFFVLRRHARRKAAASSSSQKKLNVTALLTRSLFAHEWTLLTDLECLLHYIHHWLCFAKDLPSTEASHACCIHIA